jgi:hypothetical protein
MALNQFNKIRTSQAYMRPPASVDVTKLLLDWNGGDEEALPRLLPLVYQELHRLARRYMAQERPGHTLQASALVNQCVQQRLACSVGVSPTTAKVRAL